MENLEFDNNKNKQDISLLSLDILLNLYKYRNRPEKEICDYALEQGIKLTNSNLGFIGFVVEDDAVLEVHSWSKEAMAQCSADKQSLKFDIINGGIWTLGVKERKVSIINNYNDQHPAKHGSPTGHVELKRFMGVPILDRNRVVMLIGVANKEGYYNSFDGKFLQLLMENVWTVIKRDRTENERASLEKQFRRAQKLEALGVLAGGIAHEFNNILSVVEGYGHMLLNFPSGYENDKEKIEHICNAGRRGTELVKQILTFTRKNEQKFEVQDIAPIIKDSLKMIRVTIPAMIKINEDIDEDCPAIYADTTHIHQIVTNLCTNAFHSMEETGGEITVSLKYIDRGDAQSPITKYKEDYRVKLSVCDTGQGVPDEIKEKVFDPFFTTKEPGKGTGLGLSVIESIVKQHGGDISLLSEAGKGASFDIFFPAPKKLENKAPVPEKSILRHGTERVLVVDDEFMITDLYKNFLNELGYSVTVFNCPQEALNNFSSNPDDFDVVFTDFSMPKLSGIQLSSELLKIRPNLPIIVATGYSQTITSQKALSHGIKAFMLKPVLLDKLADVIRDALEPQVI